MSAWEAVVVNLARFLCARDMMRLSSTCKALRTLIENHCDWVWGELASHLFGLYPLDSPKKNHLGTIVAYASTPRLSAARFTSPTTPTTRLVRINVISRHPLDPSLFPTIDFWKPFADSIIDKWYSQDTDFDNMETEARSFHEFLDHNQSLLHSPSHVWRLRLCPQYDVITIHHGEIRHYSCKNRVPIYCAGAEKIKWRSAVSKLITIDSLIPSTELCASCTTVKPAKPHRKKSGIGHGPWASFFSLVGLPGTGKRSFIGKLSELFPYNNLTCAEYQIEDANLASLYFRDTKTVFISGICNTTSTTDTADMTHLISRSSAVIFVLDTDNEESSMPFLHEILCHLACSPQIPLVVAFHKFEFSSPTTSGLSHIHHISQMIKTHNPPPPKNWLVTCTSVFAPNSLARIIAWLSLWAPKFDYSKESTTQCSLS
ncbi:hypothetical protein Pelo_13634 [Pelomyxa schiedti]|nr:hypothetical protein Pelo_13634 [Pelomyxa schiedti]